MQQASFDLYGPVHSGLRHAMQASSLRLGQLDAGDADDVAEALAQLRELLGWAGEHLRIEERFLHGALRQRAGQQQMPLRLDEDHEEHRRAIELLLADAQALQQACGGPAAQALARRLYLAFNRFLAESLLHMAYEEDEINPLLWRLFSEAELRQIFAAILADERPEQIGLAVRWMMPALDPQQRAASLLGARASMPPPVFAQLLRTIEGLIAPRDWRKLAAALELAEPAEAAA